MPQHCQVPLHSLFGMSLPANSREKENLIDVLRQLLLPRTLLENVARYNWLIPTLTLTQTSSGFHLA